MEFTLFDTSVLDSIRHWISMKLETDKKQWAFTIQ